MADNMPSVSELFQNKSRNQINVAIVGAVSAGKSTLLNTIFANTYSHCKIKRTTMTPQIYYEFDGKGASKTSKTIRDENRQINENLIKKTEAQEQITLDDIQEAKYIVPRIYRFTKLVKDVYLSVYDIPGLNDARTKDLYFQYLENNFHKFDIILFVVDINSALNTSDEIDILTKIVTNAKNNNAKFGIQNKLIILANKCDEMSLDDSSNLMLEEEHAEMFDQIQTQVKQTVSQVFPELNYEILPLSSEDSYIYRILEQNPDTELDLKYLNKFGYMEFGRTRWNKLTEEKKKVQIKKLMRDWDLEASLDITGFNGFRNALNSCLVPENQKMFVNNHIIYELQNITGNTKVDISAELQTFYEYYLKYKCLNSRIKTGINVMEVFSKHMTNFLEGYKSSVLSGFINIEGEQGSFVYSVKNEQFIPQIEKSKEVVDNMVRLFNGDVPMIRALSNMINDALTKFYTQQIDNKSKPVSTLFDYIKSLLGFNKPITSTNIDNFFDNPDMTKSSASKIIGYINDFERKGLLDSKTKITKVVDVLIKIYRNISEYTTNSEPNTEYLKVEDIPSYVYYADKFWSKFIMFNDEYDECVEELAFLSKSNVVHRFIGSNNKVKFNSNRTELMKLELYCLDIYKEHLIGKMQTEYHRDPQRESMRSKRKYKIKSSTTSSDSENEDLGGEIDSLLGLA